MDASPRALADIVGVLLAMDQGKQLGFSHPVFIFLRLVLLDVIPFLLCKFGYVSLIFLFRGRYILPHEITAEEHERIGWFDGLLVVVGHLRSILKCYNQDFESERDLYEDGDGERQ